MADACFVVTRRIHVNEDQAAFIDQKMANCNKIYNTAAKYYMKQVSDLRENSFYKEAKKALIEAKKAGDKEGIAIWKAECDKFLADYKISKSDIEKYMNYQRNKAFGGSINADIVQKLAAALWKAVSKAVFEGTEIHYRKRGETNCLEAKKANTGITFDKDKNLMKFCGKHFVVAPIRKKDKYMQEAMTHDIVFCKIVRKPFKSGYRYFLQILMKGEAPKKIKPGKGKCGIDDGVSTLSYYNDTSADFVELAPNIAKYDKMIRQAAQKYERRIRLNNPDCYNKDGTLKKSAKLTVRSKDSQRALMELKNAYRLKSEYIRQSNNHLNNVILSQCGFIVEEPMDYKALAKRTKGEAERSDKESTIKTKTGETKKIRKFKKKKRFGKSILRHAPGYRRMDMHRKAIRYGVPIITVDQFEYKASQYDHLTRTPTKGRPQNSNQNGR